MVLVTSSGLASTRDMCLGLDQAWTEGQIFWSPSG